MREMLLPMISIIIGMGFIISGYFIAVKKRYGFITDFYLVFKKYENFPAFAKRHGMIELIGGVAMLISGFVTGFTHLTRPAFLCAFFGTIIILFSLKMNKVFTKKKHYK